MGTEEKLAMAFVKVAVFLEKIQFGQLWLMVVGIVYTLLSRMWGLVFGGGFAPGGRVWTSLAHLG